MEIGVVARRRWEEKFNMDITFLLLHNAEYNSRHVSASLLMVKRYHRNLVGEKQGI